LPDGYQELLDTFRKLLLIRSWCPDRTIAQVWKPGTHRSKRKQLWSRDPNHVIAGESVHSESVCVCVCARVRVCVVHQARRYIAESLGPQYAEGLVLDLDAMWAESNSRTPMVCLLSMGSDPTENIERLAKTKVRMRRC